MCKVNLRQVLSLDKRWILVGVTLLVPTSLPGPCISFEARTIAPMTKSWTSYVLLRRVPNSITLQPASISVFAFAYASSAKKSISETAWNWNYPLDRRKTNLYRRNGSIFHSNKPWVVLPKGWSPPKDRQFQCRYYLGCFGDLVWTWHAPGLVWSGTDANMINIPL